MSEYNDIEDFSESIEPATEEDLSINDTEIVDIPEPYDNTITEDIKADICGFWENVDTTKQGAYHKYVLENPTASTVEICDGIDAGNVGAVSNLKIIKDIILGSTLVSQRKPSHLVQTKSKINSMLKTAHFAPETVKYLEYLGEEVQNKIDTFNSESFVADEIKDSILLEKTINSIRNCIYVFTFPQYELYPIKPAKNDFSEAQTYYKVGKTENSAGERIRQMLKTAMPEPTIVKRVYQVPLEEKDNLLKIEKQFHTLLKAAGHKYTDSRQVGDEWFLTSLYFLDTIATMLGLTIQKAADE